MKNEIKKDKTLGMIKILEHAVITYNDGYVAFYDAIHMTDNEVVFGKISDKNVFLKCGGIPKNNIEKIVILDKDGRNKILI